MPKTKEDVERELNQLKSYRPYAFWYAAEIDGEWGCYDTSGKLLRALSKARESVSGEVLVAQKDNAATLRKIQGRLTETFQRLAKGV